MQNEFELECNGSVNDYSSVSITNSCFVPVDPTPTAHEQERSALLDNIEVEHTTEKLNKVDKLKVSIVCDAAHLDKNCRSLMEKHELKISKKFVEKYELKSDTVKFEYIKELAEFQDENELQMAPRLSRKTISNLTSFQKMDVCRSAAVLSKETAVALRYLVQNEGWPEEALTTAKFIELFDRWFQIMKERGQTLAFSKKNMEKYQEQIEFLNEFMEFFSTIKFKHNQQSLWQI